MKIFGECEVPLCHKYRFFIRKRHVKVNGVWATSKTRQCGSCARKIKRMVR